MTGNASAVPLLAVSGTYAEMGAETGAATANLVAANLESYIRRFRDDAGLSDADIRRWGAIYHKVAKAYNPDVEAMLTGLAEGAGQPPELIYALNARTEILYGAAYAADDGCTAVAVLGTHTRDGHTLLAQNWDWHAEQGAVTFLLATRDTDGFTVLTLAEAGMLAKSGLNSAGLGVCANLLVSDADRGGEGIPYHLLLRGVLQSPTMARAHRAVLPETRISSGNLLIADRGGEAIDLEVAPEDFGYLLPENGMIAHANHFESDIRVRDKRRALSALTLLRSPRIRRLLEPALLQRQVDVEAVRSALNDHYSFPDGICRHASPVDDPVDAIITVYSIIMDLDEGALWIAPAPTCEQAWTRWQLDSLYDDMTTGSRWLSELAHA
jgi:isopenicillin-N N-acyltransferase-like protein